MINLLTRVASRLWPQRRTAFDTLRVTTTLNQFRIIAYLPVTLSLSKAVCRCGHKREALVGPAQQGDSFAITHSPLRTHH